MLVNFNDKNAAAFLSIGYASLATGEKVLVQFIHSKDAQLVSMSLPPPKPVGPHPLKR